jgi:hypothetical protein
VNFEVVQLEDNPDRDLCRYEFFEIIVRMAVIKFADLPLAPGEMVEKIIKEYLLPNSRKSLANKFRQEQIYTVEINDILKGNLVQLNKVFIKLKSRRGKYIEYGFFRKFCLNLYPNVRPDEFQQAFSFSK